MRRSFLFPFSFFIFAYFASRRTKMCMFPVSICDKARERRSRSFTPPLSTVSMCDFSALDICRERRFRNRYGGWVSVRATNVNAGSARNTVTWLSSELVMSDAASGGGGERESYVQSTSIEWSGMTFCKPAVGRQSPIPRRSTGTVHPTWRFFGPYNVQ